MTTQMRAFTAYGDVRSRSGWRRDYETVSAELTDIAAVERFRNGIHGMKVSKIEVGGVVIWRKP